MSYKFAIENENHEDFASGRVLYNQQGATSFPVRLSCEIFMRCADIMEKAGNHGPFSLYDPLCGGAYTLTILGLLYSQNINELYASDVEKSVVGLAEKNISLLTEEGLAKRLEQIESLYQEFGKSSHKEALLSGERFHSMIKKIPYNIGTSCFVSDAMKPDYSQISGRVDIVIMDLPYGEVVDWVNTTNEEAAITLLLDNLLQIMAKPSCIAITSKKKVSIHHDKYKRVDRFTIGKRQIVILQPIF